MSTTKEIKLETVEVKEGKFDITKLKRGQLQKWGQSWFLACPRCGMALRLEHDIKVENNLVTISPSIGHPLKNNGLPNGCGLHIFVRDSKIQYLPDM